MLSSISYPKVLDTLGLTPPSSLINHYLITIEEQSDVGRTKGEAEFTKRVFRE